MQPTIEAPTTASEEAHDAAAPVHDLDAPDDPEAEAPEPDEDTDATLELILTSDEHPLALARSLGVTLTHILTFLDSPPVRRRLAEIERLHALRRAHAHRLAEIAATETLTRLSAHIPATPLEARTAQLQQRAASALLRALRPTSSTSRGRKPPGLTGAGTPHHRAPNSATPATPAAPDEPDADNHPHPAPATRPSGDRPPSPPPSAPLPSAIYPPPCSSSNTRHAPPTTPPPSPAASRAA